MALPIYQVDAFTGELFAGNPAAVVPLENWLPSEVMQKIAFENNLSETAFYVQTPEGLAIRWFTPAVEVNLCGHATLASGFVVFHRGEVTGDLVEFSSRSGPLRVRREGELLVLDFPAHAPQPTPAPRGLIEAMGLAPREVWRADEDYLVLYASEAEVRGLAPDFARLETVEARGVIATAPGSGVDFVSRFFAPRVGVPEDPVTGSAHTRLTPYWAGRLGKNELTARQVSKRGGWLQCRQRGDRVEIAGRAVLYMTGTIAV
jgi:PhzF family phenazine biosynthesis protein